ncbi:MAG TPA: 8-amino-7-oxononanoate synthase [bacterium]|nr:8-amino-7-oxononanoate synthase [bacterium]
MTLSWISDELHEIEASGLLRRLRSLASTQGPVIELDGRSVINFSGNDYLGLAGDRRLIRAAQAAAGKWGAGSGSSRLISGNLAVFAKLEAALAEWLGAPAALLFTSGYHANIGAICSLAGPGDAVFSDRLNHASIIDGCRLSRAAVNIYEHGDASHLDRLLAGTAARRKLVVTETVFSMEGDVAPLPELIETTRRHNVMIMVDEAHALGVLGQSGRGALEHFGLAAADVDVLMGTLGKALGSSGAFVAGSAELIEFLVNRARTFIFTTGPAPAAAGAALEALRVIREEPWRRERALAHADRLRAALSVMGQDAGPGSAAIVPVVLGTPEAALSLSAALLDRGIYAQAIRPPTVPSGSSRLRISLCAGHTDEQVDQLIEALKEAIR